MAVPFLAGRFQAIGLFAGAIGPVPGAKLHTYAAGTLTPLATYGATGAPNANPVVCDTAGQADVYLGNASYRMRLYTPAGVLLWDEDGIVGAAPALAGDLAGAGEGAGDALLAVKQPFTGSVASTQHAANAQYTFGFQFGIDPSGVVDSTVGLQNLINSRRRPTLEYGCVVKVSSVIVLPENVDFDLNSSTINWAGPVVSAGNKGAKWDNAVFRANTIAPCPVKKNIRIRNGTINCNDWGCGVSLKQVEGFCLSDLTITNAQAAGIQIADCINGSIERITLTDCAPRSDAGYDPAVDLEHWGDGILVWYGSQAVTVSNVTAINSRVGTGRCGLCVDGPVGGSVESGRKTAAITFRDVTVKGYDRQIHVEYARGITVQNAELDFVDSGAKTFNCLIVDWNTDGTVWQNINGRSSKTLAMVAGCENARFVGGSLRKLGTDTSPAFTGQAGLYSDVTFEGTVIALGLSNANLYRWRAAFVDCEIVSTAWTQCDAYEGTYQFRGGSIARACFDSRFGFATDRLEFENVEFQEFAGDNYIARAPAGTAHLMLRRVILPPGLVKVFCGTRLTIIDMEYGTLPTIAGDPLYTTLDGEYLMPAPTTGTWAQTQRGRHPAPASGGYVGWVCVKSGDLQDPDVAARGVVKTYGAIS